MRRSLYIALLLAGCSKTEPAPTAAGSSAPAASAAAPAFDIEGFCEGAMAVGRKCEGDDELMEGNKAGLCVTTLRSARDDDSVKLDDGASKKCLADVKAAAPPLPDVRTLKTLAERFETCRTFTKDVPSLRAVKVVPLGEAKDGEACTATADCAHGLFCPANRGGKAKPTCTPQKKAGETCASNQACIGRCSRKDGNKCVSYCGSD